MKSRHYRWEDIRNDFKEYKDEDYFKLLEDTFKVSNTDDSCTIASETNALSARLKSKKDSYPRVPCLEGYCFGIFTPHRDRIDRMINTMNEETQIMKQECKVQLRNKAEERSIKEKDREYELKCNSIALDHARLEAAEKAMQMPRKK